MTDVSKILHEMRNTAGVVVNFSELLSDAVEGDEAERDLAEIRQAGERIGELCAQLEEALAKPPPPH